MSYLRLSSYILIGLFCFVVANYFLRANPHTEEYDFDKGLVSPETANKATVLSELAKRKKPSSAIGDIIRKNLGTTEGEFAFYVEDLSDGEVYYFNDEAVFPSASLYKLIVLASIMNDIQTGELTEESTVSASKDHLIAVYGGTDYGYEEAGSTISYTVSEAMGRVARISDNFAALTLAEKTRAIGSKNGKKDAMAEIATSLGLIDTEFNEQTVTSPRDIYTFFKALYEGRVVSKEASQKLINLLATAQINNRIPAQLPKDIKIAHKTGELGSVRHDAGIVFLNANSDLGKAEVGVGFKPGYIIVLMSKDIGSETETIATFADISKGIYDYLEGKH